MRFHTVLGSETTEVSGSDILRHGVVLSMNNEPWATAMCATPFGSPTAAIDTFLQLQRRYHPAMHAAATAPEAVPPLVIALDARVPARIPATFEANFGRLGQVRATLTSANAAGVSQR